MNILVVNFQDLQHPFAGGAEVHLHEIFGRIARAGHRVTLLCCGWPGAPRRCLIDGINIHRVGTRRTFALLARAYFLRHLPGPWDVIVEDLNKIALRVHRWSSSPSAVLVHHLFGRSVFTATNPAVGAGVLAVETLLGRLYRGIPMVAVSSSTARDLQRRGVEDSAITVIPNGVTAPSRARPVRRPARAPRLIYLGRLQPYKRVDIVLRAMRLLADRGTLVELDVVGDGAARSRLVALARRLRLEPIVKFHGRVTEDVKQTLLAGSTLHVTASSKEGWGLSVLEAGVWSVPTVATHVPGLRDAVIEGRTGRFVRRNDPVDLADTIGRLLHNPDHLRQLGKGAYRFAREHTWTRVASRMEQFLRDVATRKPWPSATVHFVQRHPFNNVPLVRNGGDAIPYSVKLARVTVRSDESVLEIGATIGSRDAEGRWPAVALTGLPALLRETLQTPEGARRVDCGDTIIWELWAWPTPALEWLEQSMMAALPGLSITARWSAPVLDAGPMATV